MTSSNFLQKLISKENARAAAEVALDLFFSDLSGEEKKAKLKAFLVSNVENLDDAVTLIPGWGPMLAALVDSAPVDAVQEQLCDALAEAIVQALKGVRGLTLPQ